MLISELQVAEQKKAMLDQRDLIGMLVIQHPLYHYGMNNVSQLTLDTSNSNDSSSIIVTTNAINEMHKSFGSAMDALSQDAVHDVTPPRIPYKQRSRRSLLPVVPDLKDARCDCGHEQVKELRREGNSNRTENKIIQYPCSLSMGNKDRCELNQETKDFGLAQTEAEKHTHTENVKKAQNDSEAKNNNKKVKKTNRCVRQRRTTDPLRHSAGPRMELTFSSPVDKPPRMAQRRASYGNGN